MSTLLITGPECPLHQKNVQRQPMKRSIINAIMQDFDIE